MIDCPHLSGSVCAIATDMAGRPAPTNPSACRVCSDHATPRARNAVTASMALSSVREDQAEFTKLYVLYQPLLAKVEPDRSALQAISEGVGVGSQLWRLLGELGVHHDPSCDCLSWAERLNAWGPIGCRLARAEIVERLRTARKEYGWWRSIQAAVRAATNAATDLVTGRPPWLNPLDPYGSLVDEAIRRAKASLTAVPTGREDTASHGTIAGEITHAVPTLPPSQISSKEQISAGSQPDYRAGANV